ncbi:alkaline phosphatase family protein [Burkholderia stagnalis]|uniref:alkaline phosphatase family protein n=1 Tax=Burkholderia stagnalis TaxID=1503054 RepID=UPI000F80330A|nr:alkaline phosphatase family protein [Burkholderia stagnalis]
MHRVALAGTGVALVLASAVFASVAESESHHDDDGTGRTVSPIKHVIVIVGENRTFDQVFGAYKPGNGQTVSNLLSKGIIKDDGSAGPRFSDAAQYTAQAIDPSHFELSPGGKAPYNVLPAPNTGGAPSATSDTSPPFKTLAEALAAEGNALESQDLAHLTTGATNLPQKSVDTRFNPNTYVLPNGPYQISRVGPDYDQYMASPVHRFYQAWQQADCSVAHASAGNPSGCLGDLFAWVETSAGAGSNGKSQPTPFNDQTTGEGSTALGFYNVSNGKDMPYFTALARQYTISDNYHQPVMGGTGANSIMLGTADALYFTNTQGQPAKPPLNEIEDPRPQAGTNNWYAQDGYSGGSYSNCSDPTQPGVDAIVGYLGKLPYHPSPNCAKNTYYLLNNYNPGYNGDGSLNTSTFTIPPSPVRTIADSLLEHHVSWKYYGEGWNTFRSPDPKISGASVYCNICNPFLYETAIMTNKQTVDRHFKDTTDLYSDIADGKLPAVSFVKPGGNLDGHPSSSKYGLFEGFVRKIVDSVQSQPKLWASTAIFITNDEGGGYYDSGYIQPVDFFGDGSRIPLIVVSPYSQGGRVVHEYDDHVSILKFIERNWSLAPITARSRDNLPNPVQMSSQPYVPVNAPAIGDLFMAFRFHHRDHDPQGNDGDH